MKKHTQLVRPEPTFESSYSDDVAVIRRLLNHNGFDARDGDIEWAWRRWCDDTSAAVWLDPATYPDFVVVASILDYLVPVEDD